jgi:hypothetical protein
MAWEEYFERLRRLHPDFKKFQIEFINEADFMELINHFKNVKKEFKGFRIPIIGHRAYNDIYATGFFGAQIADVLIEAVKTGRNVKIITEHMRADIIKMHEGGVEVRQNKNIHTRMFIAFSRDEDISGGLLILGSFDFDHVGLGGNRRDAGIITMHPDLVKSGVEYFETVWEDRYHSKPVNI